MQAVGITSMLPANDEESWATFTPEGYVPPKGAGLNLAWIPQVRGDYFQARVFRLFAAATSLWPIALARRWWSSSTALWPSIIGRGRIPSENACIAARRRRFAVADGGGRDRRRQTAWGRCPDGRCSSTFHRVRSRPTPDLLPHRASSPVIGASSCSAVRCRPSRWLSRCATVVHSLDPSFR